MILNKKLYWIIGISTASLIAITIPIVKFATKAKDKPKFDQPSTEPKNRFKANIININNDINQAKNNNKSFKDGWDIKSTKILGEIKNLNSNLDVYNSSIDKIKSIRTYLENHSINIFKLYESLKEEHQDINDLIFKYKNNELDNNSLQSIITTKTTNLATQIVSLLEFLISKIDTNLNFLKQYENIKNIPEEIIKNFMDFNVRNKNWLLESKKKLESEEINLNNILIIHEYIESLFNNLFINISSLDNEIELLVKKITHNHQLLIDNNEISNINKSNLELINSNIEVNNELNNVAIKEIESNITYFNEAIIQNKSYEEQKRIYQILVFIYSQKNLTTIDTFLNHLINLNKINSEISTTEITENLNKIKENINLKDVLNYDNAIDDKTLKNTLSDNLKIINLITNFLNNLNIKINEINNEAIEQINNINKEINIAFNEVLLVQYKSIEISSKIKSLKYINKVKKINLDKYKILLKDALIKNDTEKITQYNEQITLLEDILKNNNNEIETLNNALIEYADESKIKSQDYANLLGNKSDLILKLKHNFSFLGFLANNLNSTNLLIKNQAKLLNNLKNQDIYDNDELNKLIAKFNATILDKENQIDYLTSINKLIKEQNDKNLKNLSIINEKFNNLTDNTKINDDLVENLNNELATTKTKLNNANSLITSLREQIKNKQKELINLTNTNNESSDVISNIRREIFEKDKEKSNLESLITEKESEINNLNTEIERFKNELITLNETNTNSINTLRNSVTEKENEINNLNSSLNEKDLKINDLNSSIISKDEIIKEKNNSLKELNDTIDQYSREINNYRNQMGELSDEISKLQNAIILNNTEISSNKEIIRNLNAQIEALNSELTTVKQIKSTQEIKIAEYEKEIENLKKIKTENEFTIGFLEVEKQMLTDAITRNEKTIDDQRLTIANLKKENNDLTNKVNELERYYMSEIRNTRRDNDSNILILTDENQKLKIKIAELNEIIDTLNKNNNNLDSSLIAAGNKNNQLQIEIQRLNNEINNINNKYRELENNLADNIAKNNEKDIAHQNEIKRILNEKATLNTELLEFKTMKLSYKELVVKANNIIQKAIGILETMKKTKISVRYSTINEPAKYKWDIAPHGYGSVEKLVSPARSYTTTHYGLDKGNEEEIITEVKALLKTFVIPTNIAEDIKRIDEEEAEEEEEEEEEYEERDPRLDEIWWREI
ncbi:hypothetical protein GE118_03490 [Mycoplasma sp. NEAQ87857]|uniref:hypothetical protein n=1 Tax=Mycoplasma sp. NEAQ87857 TaxID=2683967 RepID=UPI001316D635|nr:hypothetical protein [Mycoplasma sp. NEAQ87857]QGZ97848.1 hypothetical protein GE118_03490 [Mycoplasma sp. NEAQ87857]